MYSGQLDVLTSPQTAPQRYESEKRSAHLALLASILPELEYEANGCRRPFASTKSLPNVNPPLTPTPTPILTPTPTLMSFSASVSNSGSSLSLSIPSPDYSSVHPTTHLPSLPSSLSSSENASSDSVFSIPDLDTPSAPPPSARLNAENASSVSIPDLDTPCAPPPSVRLNTENWPYLSMSATYDTDDGTVITRTVHRPRRTSLGRYRARSPALSVCSQPSSPRMRGRSLLPSATAATAAALCSRSIPDLREVAWSRPASPLRGLVCHNPLQDQAYAASFAYAFERELDRLEQQQQLQQHQLQQPLSMPSSPIEIVVTREQSIQGQEEWRSAVEESVYTERFLSWRRRKGLMPLIETVAVDAIRQEPQA